MRRSLAPIRLESALVSGQTGEGQLTCEQPTERKITERRIVAGSAGLFIKCSNSEAKAALETHVFLGQAMAVPGQNELLDMLAKVSAAAIIGDASNEPATC